MIYFNNTATSYPKPKSVNDAVNEYLSNPPVHSARMGLDKDDDDAAYAARKGLNELFNGEDPDRFIFTSGSTESLNLAIKGLDLNGRHVVTTNIEHNSVIRPLNHLKNEGKIEITWVDCDKHGYVTPEDIEAAITDKTKLIVVNHCSNVTGAVLDLKAIAEVAHRHNLVFLVDASQSAGGVPIDLKNWKIDLLAFTGHKSLYGIQGIGGIYIRKGIELKPLIVGGTGVKSEVLVQPEGMPIFYEAGTPNTPGIVSLAAGVKFVLEESVAKIHDRKAEMVLKMMNAFDDYPEVEIYTSTENNSLSNFCFNINGMVPEEVGYFLDESADIVIRSGLHCAPLLLPALGVYPWGTVRVSPSYFSADDEIDLFIAIIKDAIDVIVRKGKGYSKVAQ